MENYTEFEEIKKDEKEIAEELKETEATQPDADFSILEEPEQNKQDEDEYQETETDFEGEEKNFGFGVFMAELNCFILPPLTGFILKMMNKKPFNVGISGDTKEQLTEYYNLIFEGAEISPTTRGYLGILTVNASYIFTAYLFSEDLEPKQDEQPNNTEFKKEPKKRGRPRKVKI